MIKRLCLLTVPLLLVLAAPAGAVIVPQKGMAGAHLGQCIEDVVKKLGLKIRFSHGAGQCLVAGEFFTSKGRERTTEGVGKGTMRTTLKAKLERVKCDRKRSCHIGSFTPSKKVTEFRIDSKGRVSRISVRYVVD